MYEEMHAEVDMKIGFDNEKYLKLQSEHILERIRKFDNKLYLEFGGKLFDDYHASRVLPGFMPDSKLRMLLELKEQAEIVFVISAEDIESNKIRGDLGITYDLDVLRLIDAFRNIGMFVGSVCITKYAGQTAADQFSKRLTELGIRAYRHYKIPGYPSDINTIVSDDGYGKNEYIETTRPLVVITAPGPGSGKMATCLSQLYHEHKRGIKAGYAKFETFPIWNLPLKHPVNVAYEAATADLNDVNMIDPFHLEAYGETTVNYNRDVEIFPVLNAIFEKISGKSPYKSPTDMGVNMVGKCIIDDEATREASAQEIIRRYYSALCGVRAGKEKQDTVFKILAETFGDFLVGVNGVAVTSQSGKLHPVLFQKSLQLLDLLHVFIKNVLIAAVIKLFIIQIQRKGHQFPGLDLITGDALFAELRPQIQINVVDGTDHCLFPLFFLTNYPHFHSPG